MTSYNIGSMRLKFSFICLTVKTILFLSLAVAPEFFEKLRRKEYFNKKLLNLNQIYNTM